MGVRDLLFEIGTEEMPSAQLNRALEQLRRMVPAALDEAHLAHGAIRIDATPRRFALRVADVAEQQPDRHDEFRGPAVSLAFDAEGQPTKAAFGFARGKGVSVEDLEQREVDGTPYVFAVTATTGRAAEELLPELLSGFLTDIDWKRSQRWGSGDERFVRPVRWLVALFGDETVLPVHFGALVAGRTSQGCRFLPDRAVTLTRVAQYEEALRAKYVVLSQEERRARILADIERLSAPYGTALIDEGVLSEVVNLTEWPNGLVGTFDASFLRIPREIIVDAMSKHQRYFAIERPDGSLDNHYLVISNGFEQYGPTIVEGHNRVVRARLADAAFFFDEDRKVPLDTWLQKLDHVVFQEKLGTTGAKVKRIEALTAFLADSCGLDAAVRVDALRAAHLAKADLVTNAVIEFTELQGIMGSYYAAEGGENPVVSRAIREHYQPRFSGDAIPTDAVGQVVAVADKVDTIAGIFAAGKAPKGTSDPFGLRRAAIGVIQIGLSGIRLDLDALVAAALDGLADLAFDRATVESAVTAFFTSRLERILRDAGHEPDTVAAVLAASSADPADAAGRCAALTALRKENDAMDDLSVAFKRARNLSNPTAGTTVDHTALQPVEQNFVQAVIEARTATDALFEADDYAGVLARFAALREPVDAFFDQVMILDEDPNVRANRLAMLNVFVGLFERFADFSALAV